MTTQAIDTASTEATTITEYEAEQVVRAYGTGVPLAYELFRLGFANAVGE